MWVGPKLFEKILMEHGSVGDKVAYNYKQTLGILKLSFIVLKNDEMTIIPVRPYIPKLKESVTFAIQDITELDINNRKVSIAFKTGEKYNWKFPVITSKINTYQISFLEQLKLLKAAS